MRSYPSAAVRPTVLISLVCSSIAWGAPTLVAEVKAELDARVARQVARPPPKVELLFEGVDPHRHFLHEGHFTLDGQPLPEPPRGEPPRELRIWTGQIAPGPHVLVAKLTYARAEFSGSFSPGLGVDQQVGSTLHFVARPGLLLRIHARVRPTDSGGLKLVVRLEPVLLPSEPAPQGVAKAQLPSPKAHPTPVLARVTPRKPSSPPTVPPAPKPAQNPLAVLRAKLRGVPPTPSKLVLDQPVVRPPPIVAPLAELRQRALRAGLWTPPRTPPGPKPTVDPLAQLREKLRRTKSAPPKRPDRALAHRPGHVRASPPAPKPTSNPKVDPLAALRAKLRASSAVRPASASKPSRHGKHRRRVRAAHRKRHHRRHRRHHRRSHPRIAAHHGHRAAPAPGGADAATLRLRALLKKAAAKASTQAHVHPRFAPPRRSAIPLHRFYGPRAVLQAPHGAPPGEPITPSPQPVGNTVWIGVLLGVGAALLLGVALLRSRRGRG